MEAYQDFSAVYDRLMQDVNYDGWCDLAENVFRRLGVSPKLMLELGCGTGNLTVRLAERGYSMIGLDLSPDMLTRAAEKSEGKDILYLLRDMTDFELYGTVDAALCSLDGLNYLTEDGDLERCFSLVSLFLNPGGVFFFDLNTQYKMEQVLAPETFLYDDEEVFYAWQSFWDGTLCEYDLTFFVREGERYRKFTETHCQRPYGTAQVEEALRKAGLQPVRVFDGAWDHSPQSTSERLFYTAVKPAK